MSLRRRVPVSARHFDEEKQEIWSQRRRDRQGANVEWQDPYLEGCDEEGGHICKIPPNENMCKSAGCSKTNTFTSGNRHVHFDKNIPDKILMSEFYAWKEMYYEEKMQKLKHSPDKVQIRAGHSNVSMSSRDDFNENHPPGGGPPLSYCDTDDFNQNHPPPPLSGSAMRTNLLGAIQLKRRSSEPTEEKFDPTKSIPNLVFEGPREEPEPTESFASPPPAVPSEQPTASGGDPMKNLLGAIQLQKPETDFVEEKFDPTKSIPNLAYEGPVEEPIEEATTEEPVEEKLRASSYDSGFVTSRTVRIANNQSPKEFTAPSKSQTKSKLSKSSHTQTKGPPSLTSVLSAAQPERQPSTRLSSNAGVDNSVKLVRPSLVRFSQTGERPSEGVRDQRSRENTEGNGGHEDETLISSHNIYPPEPIDHIFGRDRETSDHLLGHVRQQARPLIMVNEDNTIRAVKHKHELNDILRATTGDHMPELPREIQNYVDKFHDVPLNKLMHYAETGSYLRESYLDSNICDIRVHVGKDTYPAHRIVLACFSPYLASVLEHENPLKHKKPKDIRISGVSERSVKVLLNYVYTGDLRMETVLIPDFIKLADKFDVAAVRQKCFDQVESISDDELLALLSVMKDTHDVEYCDRIMKSIASKFMRVRDCKTFFQLDINTLCMVLSYDALILRSEMDIFYSGLNWLQNGDAKERCKYLDRVMDCVRFPLMNQAELYECVERCSLLKSSATCIQRIHEANWLMTMSMLHKQDPLRLYVPPHRNNINSSASVSDYITRTCSRVKTDVTVEVARESSPKNYNSEPGMSRAKYSPTNSQGGPRNNNSHVRTHNNNAGGTGEESCDTEQVTYVHNESHDQRKLCESPLFKMGHSTSKDVADEGLNMDPSRNHTIVVINKRMYMIGGCVTKQGVPTPRRDVLMYDKSCWTWNPVAPLLTARMYHCLCVVNGQIYALGGIGEDNSILHSVECYNPSTNCWYFVKAMSEGRMGACAAEYGGQLYVAGGYGDSVKESEQFPILDSIECFNPHSNKWTSKLNMRYGRCFASLVSVGQSLYLCGGFAINRGSHDHYLSSVSDVDEYDILNDTWIYKNRLCIGRHDAACFMSDDKIYLIGGISSQLEHALCDVECFDPQRNVIYKAEDTPYQIHWIKCAVSKN